MRHIDLEMYKWRWHHSVYVPSLKIERYRSYEDYWTDAGFFSILPRRVGKTAMIVDLTKYFDNNKEDYLVVCLNKRTCSIMESRGVDRNKITLHHGCDFRGLNKMNINLLVDEFTSMGAANANMMSFRWKTVTMISSI